MSSGHWHLLGVDHLDIRFAHGEHELCITNSNTPVTSRESSPKRGDYRHTQSEQIPLNINNDGGLIPIPLETHVSNRPTTAIPTRRLVGCNNYCMDDGDMQLVNALVSPVRSRETRKMAQQV